MGHCFGSAGRFQEPSGCRSTRSMRFRNLNLRACCLVLKGRAQGSLFGSLKCWYAGVARALAAGPIAQLARARA